MRVVFGVGLFFALMGAAQAAPISTKVEQLIQKVETSGCEFHRNGDVHNSIDAADHMRFKYDYYKENIETITQFIEKVGTKSSFSGKIYEVACMGEEKIPSANWLRLHAQDLE